MNWVIESIIFEAIFFRLQLPIFAQPTFTYSNSTIETSGQCVKSVQS